MVTRVLLAVIALTTVAAAEQAEQCSLPAITNYDPTTNEVTATQRRGVTMRGPNGNDTCAEPDKVQFWMNQGYTVVTDEQRDRELAAQVKADTTPSGDGDSTFSDTTVMIVLGAALGALGYWYVVTRKK